MSSELSRTLVIKPDSLIPDQIYTLRAEVTNSQNVLLGSNSIFLVANSPPTSGRLVFSTPSPNKFDRVDVSAEGWVDQETPLSYLFSLTVPGYPNEIFLGDATDSSSLSMLVPTGGPATVTLRVSDSEGAQAEYSTQVTFGDATVSAPSLEQYATRVSWGDTRTAAQIATAILLTNPSALTNATLESVISPLHSRAQAGQIGPLGAPSLLSIVSLATLNPAVLSSTVATQATEILSYIVQAAESEPAAQRVFSASTSKLGRVVALSFLNAAAGVARTVSQNGDISSDARAKLMDLLSRLVLLQARSSAVDESSQTLSSQFVNVTSQIFSALTPLSTPTGTVTLNFSAPILGTVSVQTISWSPGAFPYANAPFQSNVITIILNDGTAGTVNVEFNEVTSPVTSNTTCGRLDEQTQRWTNQGCSLSSSNGKYSCSCSLPTSSSGSGQRISISLLFGSVTSVDPPSISSPGSSSNAGGLSPGGAAAIAVVMIIIVGAAIGAAIFYIKKRKFDHGQRQRALARLESSQPADSAGKSPPSPEVHRSSSWKHASKPIRETNMAE